jgi:hypothetical protein
MPTRKIPRPFSMHWGSGPIIEEAGFDGDHTATAIQLMRFDNGEAAGSQSIRFCHFSHRGQLQRSPLIISEDKTNALREAVAQTPELQRLLLRIAGG